MGKIFIPDDYTPALDLKETQIAIKKVKDFFQRELATELNLRRVTAPLFVAPESGLNDNLNGVERPVSFGIKEPGRAAPWRSFTPWQNGNVWALGRYGFAPGEGLYTDMNAIRRMRRPTISIPFMWISGTGRRLSRRSSAPRRL